MHHLQGVPFLYTGHRITPSHSCTVLSVPQTRAGSRYVSESDSSWIWSTILRAYECPTYARPMQRSWTSTPTCFVVIVPQRSGVRRLRSCCERWNFACADWPTSPSCQHCVLRCSPRRILLSIYSFDLSLVH